MWQAQLVHDGQRLGDGLLSCWEVLHPRVHHAQPMQCLGVLQRARAGKLLLQGKTALRVWQGGLVLEQGLVAGASTEQH